MFCRRKTRGITGGDDASKERVLREILKKQERTYAQLKEESFTSSAQNSPTSKNSMKLPSSSNMCASPSSSARGIQGSERSPVLQSSSNHDMKQSHGLHKEEFEHPSKQPVTREESRKGMQSSFARGIILRNYVRRIQVIFLEGVISK